MKSVNLALYNNILMRIKIRSIVPSVLYDQIYDGTDGMKIFSRHITISEIHKRLK